jgi:hypothetical protein
MLATLAAGAIAKDKIAIIAMRLCLDQCQCRRAQRQNMLTMSFRPGPGDRPKIASYFAPLHRADFIATLGGEQ